MPKPKNAVDDVDGEANRLREYRRAIRKRYEAKHPDKQKARDKRRYDADPEGQRERARTYRRVRGAEGKRREYAGHLRRTYGITFERFSEMLIAQDGLCYICSQPFGYKVHRDACVDHDHDTGEVRKLLCRDCNLGVGYLERPGFYTAAHDYLINHSSRATF